MQNREMDKRNTRQAAPDTAYAKGQWLEAKEWGAGERDMLHALLQENERYTKAQVNALLQHFLIQEVK
ncbi:hypothetical protein [Paenibacillus apiarius]|uniref:Uncharacterized protein n=1 Tax=Paenibacillus apiarius TaxID=46240 RepID=A0ABT4DR85_9BACL|nr:hypothetical protein [Paenibacillus apiarius]MBN3523105.1 hypothetical protein [Paenibacillus apiarius]MCY9516720.1 hypothetical protein [Paenibacillus apiarius]MCY9519882.1 hypothetical protein [Paenibacillus apiarius]MCY9553880.1 hypothetical protein [Paenibacillus apiarius]MCY9557512.1 hypothetical protein [Paenibacillus apiarius]